MTCRVALVLMAMVVSACTAIRGSGEVISIDVPVDDINRLVVSHSFEVNVTVGETPSLTLTLDDNLEAGLDVGMDGDTLRIGLKPRTTVTNATLQADLTVDSLEAIEGSGAVGIHLSSTLTGSSLDLRLSGASTIDGQVDSETMDGEISGASDVTLSGRAGTVVIDASGASDLSLLELEVAELKISLSGASSAEVKVKDSIEASLSGASSLGYRGDPDVTTLDVSGSSSIGRITEPG